MTLPLEQGWSLVLSGGGARGAYAAGAVRYLAENCDRYGIEPVAFAGASIGALNGAVLAAAPSLKEGSDRLVRVWEELDIDRILKFQIGQGGLAQAMAIGAALLAPVVPTAALSTAVGALLAPGASGLIESGVLSDDYLSSLLEREALSGESADRPLWISAYRTQGAWVDVARIILAELGGPDTPESEFLLLQDIPRALRLQALLASAALPVAYGKRRLQGTDFRDGGIGSWRTSDGNTPLRPLTAQGCRRAIVIHLADGSLWDRHRYPDTAIVEIRPQEAIHPEGGLLSLVNFYPERLAQWMEQGYSDAKRCVGRSMDALTLRDASIVSRGEARKALADLAQDDLGDVIKLLES